MSDVEKYYNKLREHFPEARPWGVLHPQEQQQIVMSINLILSVLTRG